MYPRENKLKTPVNRSLAYRMQAAYGRYSKFKRKTEQQNEIQVKKVKLADSAVKKVRSVAKYRKNVNCRTLAWKNELSKKANQK